MPLWRVITARKASADFFSGIADFGEWQAVMEITGIWDPTNPGPTGNLASVPRNQWVTGPGSSFLMAPFAFHQPGRFGDGSYGVLYAAMDEATAIAEAASSRARFLRNGHIARETLDHLILQLDLHGLMEDARPLFKEGSPIYRAEDWTAGQAFGSVVRASGGEGVAYASVRRMGGNCVAGFRPNLFSNCRPGGTVQFFWDGKAIQGPDGFPGLNSSRA